MMLMVGDVGPEFRYGRGEQEIVCRWVVNSLGVEGDSLGTCLGKGQTPDSAALW